MFSSLDPPVSKCVFPTRSDPNPVKPVAVELKSRFIGELTIEFTLLKINVDNRANFRYPDD